MQYILYICIMLITLLSTPFRSLGHIKIFVSASRKKTERCNEVRAKVVAVASASNIFYEVLRDEKNSRKTGFRESCGDLLISQMKRILFKQNNELLNPASFRQGLPEPRSQGRDAAHPPWILDPGNPCRDDDVFLTCRYGCVSFSSVPVVCYAR